MPRRSIVVTHPILPETVQEDRVRLNMLTAIQRVAADVKREFQRTVRTWNHKVTFDTSKRLTRSQARQEGEYGFSVTTDDQIWGWLNEGTDVRRVTMSPDFEPKTTPDTFDSVEGANPIALGFGEHQGIQARNWTKMAEEQYERPLLRSVTDAILAGLENQRLPRRGR